jgi:hypothetical protein
VVIAVFLGVVEAVGLMIAAFTGCIAAGVTDLADLTSSGGWFVGDFVGSPFAEVSARTGIPMIRNLARAAAQVLFD